MANTLVKLSGEQLHTVQEAVNQNGKGTLIKENFSMNSVQDTLFITEDTYPQPRYVFLFLTNGHIYRIGFFDNNGVFVHASFAKDYYASLNKLINKKYDSHYDLHSEEGEPDDIEEFLFDFDELFN